MNTNEIVDKKRKRVLATFIDLVDNTSSVEIITREAFENAVHKLPNRNTSDGLPWSRSHYLGEGSYGMVYRAMKNGDIDGGDLPSEMAIKHAPMEYSSSLINEEQILTTLSSSYVVRCYGSRITKLRTQPDCRGYNLILEYCAGGSIADFLKKQGMVLQTDVQLFAKVILKGINYLHSKKIIHCDIKPDNILLKPSEDPFMTNQFQLKLADFGLALEKKSDESKNGEWKNRGTFLYMSLELLRDGILDYGADIWAYGCTILEMFTGTRPWSGLRFYGRQKMKECICNSEINQEIPTWVSVDARDFLEKCLEKDPTKRFDSDALLNHKFVTSVTSVDVRRNGLLEDQTSSNKDEA